MNVTKKGCAPKLKLALVPQTLVKRRGVFDLKLGAAELLQFLENAKGFYPFGKIADRTNRVQILALPQPYEGHLGRSSLHCLVCA
jgi:hypothetical protein